MKKIISLFLFVALIFSATSCKKTPLIKEEEKKEYSTRSETLYEYFNTVSIITSYGTADETTFKNYITKSNDLLGYYHKLFDIYYEYAGVNNLCTVNKNAGKSPVKVDAELINFLEYCKELYTLTNQKMNIMFGSVLKIWHYAREEADEDFGYLNPNDLPTEKELREANTYTSIDLLVIDKEASTVYISDPNASIDVGAIGKGYAVERLYEALKGMGADNVALNIGGNIRTIGLKPGNEKWVTGITNPDRTSDKSFVCRVKIGDTSLVTSGDYERYFISGNQKYHHIIDPDTLMPSTYFSSVSIFTKDSGLADALSTALFCMSYEEGLEIVNNIGGIEVLWVYRDGTVKHTDGIEFVD